METINFLAIMNFSLDNVKPSVLVSLLRMYIRQSAKPEKYPEPIIETINFAYNHGIKTDFDVRWRGFVITLYINDDIYMYENGIMYRNGNHHADMSEKTTEEIRVYLESLIPPGFGEFDDDEI